MKFFLYTITLIFLLIVLCSGVAVSEDLSWEDMNNQTTEYYKDQKFIKAAGAGRQALNLARNLPEPEQEKMAISLGNLAMIYTHLGKFAEAEAHAQEELVIREKIFGKEHMEVVKAWNHLAIVYTMAQAPDDAEICLLKIISLNEEIYGKESPGVLASLKKLEKFYQISKNKKKENEIATRIEKFGPAKR